MDLKKQRFGAHMSIAGGLHNAFDHGTKAGCACLQVFVKNQRQWSAKPLTDEDVARWKSAAAKVDWPVVAHNTYLVNLAATNEETKQKSILATVDELTRCERLGIRYLVMHPGSHVGAGEAAGLKKIIRGIDQVHKQTKGFSVQLLLETTAGQGTNLGYRFEQLATILEGVKQPERLNVCVDTCHIFAAGYDIVTPDGYAETMDRLDEIVGLDRIKCIHVNDSRGERGSRLDRHAHITAGEIGREGFRNLVNDTRLADVPKILETPKGEDEKGRDLDRLNIQRLRRLIKK